MDAVEKSGNTDSIYSATTNCSVITLSVNSVNGTSETTLYNVAGTLDSVLDLELKSPYDKNRDRLRRDFVYKCFGRKPVYKDEAEFDADREAMKTVVIREVIPSMRYGRAR